MKEFAMQRIFILAFFIAAFDQGSASDLPCSLQGGTCTDWRYTTCSAGYETGLCDGDSNRKCCLSCDSNCKADEETFNMCCDSACTNKGGDCKHNTNYCYGSYTTGLCGGPTERQCCISPAGSGSGCYGNIMNVDTTGASSQTSSQDNLFYSGVAASEKMAETDKNRVSQYTAIIHQAATVLCVDPNVIAAIISRETRGGNGLNSNGFGSDGHGYGIMQVDDRYHTLEGGPYSLEHVLQGTEILIGMINGVAGKHSSWTQDMALKGGICAYNSGVSNVQTYDNMDSGTTGNDYSNDVTARAQYYVSNPF